MIYMFRVYLGILKTTTLAGKEFQYYYINMPTTLLHKLFLLKPKRFFPNILLLFPEFTNWFYSPSEF